MSKSRSLLALGRKLSWPAALLVSFAATVPATLALVACSGGSDEHFADTPTTAEGTATSGTWPASDQTTEALDISTWHMTTEGVGAYRMDGLNAAGSVVWTVSFSSANGVASFVASGGRLDISADGITNTLDPSSKFGLAALGYDLNAAGAAIPDQSEIGESSIRNLLVTPDAATAADAGGSLIFKIDSGLLVKPADAGAASFTCEAQAFLVPIAGNLGPFLTNCVGAASAADGGALSTIEALLNNKCTSNFTSAYTQYNSALASCSGGDAGAAKAVDSGAKTDGGATTSLITPLTGSKLVGSVPAPDASAGAQAAPGYTITINLNFGGGSDGGAGVVDAGGGTVPDSGTSVIVDAGGGDAATVTVLPPTTLAPYPSGGYVLLDDAINTDESGVACGATLIGKNVAVTSASCLWVKNTAGGYDAPWTRHRFAFGSGAVSDTSRGASREAVQVIAHPDYVAGTSSAANTAVDIGLLFLVPVASSSTLSVATPATAMPALSEMGVAYGYGLTSPTENVTSTPNASFRKTFAFALDALDTVKNQTFHVEVAPTTVLCNGDQGSGAFDSNSNLLGPMSGSSITAACTAGSGATYLNLAAFSSFRQCAITKVADQTESFSGPTTCR